MLRDQHIICLSSIDWDFLWQGQQQIMSSFAEHGNRVLFVESTGVRAPTPRDIPRLWRRARGGGRGGHGQRRPPDNLRVYSPVVPPLPYSSIARTISLSILRRGVRRHTRGWGRARPIVWSFLPTPLSRSLVRALNPVLSIFHSVDHLAASSTAAARLRASETLSLEEADLVFVTSHALLERARQLNADVHLLPSSVDFPRFACARQTRGPLPDDLRRVPRPVIGYLGGLHKWLDQALLSAVATRCPEWSIVLVGPIQTDVSGVDTSAQRLCAWHPRTRPGAGLPAWVRRGDRAVSSDRVHPPRVSGQAERVPRHGTRRRGDAADGYRALQPGARRNRLGGDRARGVRRCARGGVVRARPGPGASSRRGVAQTNSWTRRLDQMSSVITAALARRHSCAASSAN